MNKTIEITKKESGFIQYNNFKLEAIQNAIGVFIQNTNNFEYSDNQLNRILDKYTETYMELTEKVKEIAKKNNINVDKRLSYTYQEDTIIFLSV